MSLTDLMIERVMRGLKPHTLRAGPMILTAQPTRKRLAPVTISDFITMNPPRSPPTHQLNGPTDPEILREFGGYQRKQKEHGSNQDGYHSETHLNRRGHRRARDALEGPDGEQSDAGDDIRTFELFEDDELDGPHREEV
jgi:hypothetical protein